MPTAEHLLLEFTTKSVESWTYVLFCRFCTVKGMVVESEELKAQNCALSKYGLPMHSNEHYTTMHDDNILQTTRPHSEQSNDNDSISKCTTKPFAYSKKPLKNTQFAGNASSFKSQPPTDITNLGALLMVVPVTLENKNTFISTYAFLDSGTHLVIYSQTLLTICNARSLDQLWNSKLEGFTSPNHWKQI